MIDMKKKYRTRDGREARLYAVDGMGQYVVHGAILEPHGWIMRLWASGGQSYRNGLEDEMDLIEIKPSAIDQMIAIIEHAQIGWRPDSGSGRLCAFLLTEAKRIKAESGDE